MKIAFLGTSHAVGHMLQAARAKGFNCVPDDDADLVFVSEDTPTDGAGVRDLETIRGMVIGAGSRYPLAEIVLTSAVPPGFCRAMRHPFLTRPIWHQLEMLRIGHETERAQRPEMIVVGGPSRRAQIPPAYMTYLKAWGCPVLQMLYEEAELAKIAINTFLAAQVDTTNRLHAALMKVSEDEIRAGREPLDWGEIRRALQLDRRIGEHAYLSPGRWQDSRHLLRDSVTLAEIEAA